MREIIIDGCGTQRMSEKDFKALEHCLEAMNLNSEEKFTFSFRNFSVISGSDNGSVISSNTVLVSARVYTDQHFIGSDSVV